MSVRSAMAMIALAVFGAAAASAQAIAVKVDRTEITIEDQVRMDVTIEGSASAEPVLPELPDFAVRSLGRSQQLQVSNGRITRGVTYSYSLSPRREGDLRIGPAKFMMGGRTYQSRALIIRVLAASSRPEGDRVVFVRARTSTLSPFVGEQVIFTWRFLRRPRSSGGAELISQEFGDFLVEDLGEVREYVTTIAGREYEVSEIRKALFAQEAGMMIIPSWELVCQVFVQGRSPRRRGFFDDFFSRTQSETRVLRTPPIELDVRPLPAAPADFSGLIGVFETISEVNKESVALGGSLTQTVTVKGRGNVQMISKPSSRVSEQEFKVYEEKPTTSVKRAASGLSGERLFPRALLPLREGTLTVPAVALVYFDPGSETYREARAAAIDITVLPALESEDLRLTESLAPTTGKVAVRILADSLLPIHRGVDLLDRWNPSVFLTMVGTLIPPFFFMTAFAIRRRRSYLQGSAGPRRRRGARGRALKALGAVTADGGRESGELLSRIVRQFVGDCLGIEGGALTWRECGEWIRRAGADPDAASELEQILRDLDGAQYAAGGAAASAVDRQRISVLLKRLDTDLG